MVPQPFLQSIGDYISMAWLWCAKALEIYILSPLVLLIYLVNRFLEALVILILSLEILLVSLKSLFPCLKR